MSDPKKKLEELREAKAKRDEARAAEAEAAEVLLLELEERFEKELGKRGLDYEIVATKQAGPIVVRRGEDVLYKKFLAATKNDLTPEAVYSYVAPCIAYPERDKFNALNAKFPAIAMRCANALAALHGAKEADDQGKY